MSTYQTKRVGELAITPRNDKAVKTIAFFTEQGFSDKALVDVAKAQTDDFSVTEVDYCAMLSDVRNDDILLAFARVAKAAEANNWQAMIDNAAEVTAAIDAACTAERKKFGVSSRYEFSATTGKWMRKESTPRAPKAEGVTVGEAAQPSKKVVHVATKGAIRFESGSTNELYSKVLHAVKGGEYKFTATKWNTVGKKLLKASGWQYSTELK